MATPANGDNRVAWGFFYDHKIGKIRPLCGKPKQPKGQGTRKG